MQNFLLFTIAKSKSAQPETASMSHVAPQDARRVVVRWLLRKKKGLGGIA
ncbi:hypothetical protein K3X48_04140 [Aliiroseovarius crassostreae]|uniref:Uncharacterized protein n=1 Tax=Aliiroseovarius crassostreae TaxID=154981 RepID=A0A9Q9HFB2_9RHOB|nr:hypothetical protein [Aliiroseovarius crassostreae]UWP96187.1 hypothetical protein K3X48_04140 [Aliiroseovarius crassostreae]